MKFQWLLGASCLPLGSSFTCSVGLCRNQEVSKATSADGVSNALNDSKPNESPSAGINITTFLEEKLQTLSPLADLTIPTDVANTLENFWMDKAWYENFLKNKLREHTVQIGEWVSRSRNIGSSCNEGRHENTSREEPQSENNCTKTSIKERSIESFHPSHYSFPGLPDFIQSSKVQTIEQFCGGFIIRERNNFRGIPFAEYFRVKTEWVITTADRPTAAAKAAEASPVITGTLSDELMKVGHVASPHVKSPSRVVVFHEVEFFKKTWVRGMIESNTKKELMDVYKKWNQSVHEVLNFR